MRLQVKEGAGFSAKLGAFVLLLWISISGLSGCLVRHRQRIEVRDPAVFQNATLQVLLDKIKAQQESIETLNATATIEPTVTGKGEIVNYRDIKAFILVRKPGFIRMMGLYPVVQNKAFDMASDGETFRLLIPIRNRFVVGRNQENPKPSQSSLENLRPQHILDALLLRGPEAGTEEAFLEVSSDGMNSFYVINVLQLVDGRWPLLARKIWVERTGLAIVRLQMYNEQGEEVTDVLYGNYVPASGIPYPREIVVRRPKDQYSLRLVISAISLNEPITEDKFILEQPPGTQLTNMDDLPPSGGSGG